MEGEDHGPCADRGQNPSLAPTCFGELPGRMESRLSSAHVCTFPENSLLPVKFFKISNLYMPVV